MKFVVVEKHRSFKFRLMLLQLLLIASTCNFNLGISTLVYGSQTESRLWRIDKDGIKSSYILATMHSEDPRILKLPDNYTAIFKAALSFTAEVDLSVDNSMILIKTMMLPKDKNLRKIIGDELFTKSVTILNGFGIPEKRVNKMKPWAVLMTLSYPKPKSGLFLDKLLFDRAMEMGKKCYGLESLQEQIAIFDNISYLDQTILLRDSVKLYPEFDEQLETLKQLYLQGDLEGLSKFNKQVMLKGNYRVASKLMTRLIDKRNTRMVQRMQPQLKEGGAFIAVGALHLPGKSGILQLLRAQQYQLTAIQ